MSHDKTCCCNDKQAEFKPQNQKIAQESQPSLNGYVSLFEVPKMDCPSEEQMIRMALENIQPMVSLEFDIPGRQVRVYHNGSVEQIKSALEALELGARLKSSRAIDKTEMAEGRLLANEREQQDANTLKALLLINGIMFVLELIVGWYAQSTGLIADSLDMFADAAVYGLALYAVGRSAKLKLRAAHISGWLQMLLAFGALFEVGRRYWFGSEPVSSLMMGFGVVALIANVSCLLLIAKHKNDGAHMKASWIFSANDVIANSGVIVAGLLVAWTGSRYPDLVIGLIIALIVLNGARTILKLKAEN